MSLGYMFSLATGCTYKGESTAISPSLGRDPGSSDIGLASSSPAGGFLGRSGVGQGSLKEAVTLNIL